MAFDKQDSFETESVVLGGEEPTEQVGIFAGIGLPWDEVINAPVGSSYFRTNNEKYRKTGAGNLIADWTLGFDPNSGSSPVNQCIPFYLASGVQNNIPLAGQEIPFFLSNGTMNNIPIVAC